MLRVPESSLDQALAQITGSAGVGKELSRSASAQDVTGDLADLQSRVATQRASVERIRALLGKAGSLRDVGLLESEVTKREADLEALEARQAALADRADLATLTVDLRTAAAVIPAPETKRNAFLEGLDSGWQALVASMTVVLTVLGALLPLAIVLVLVGGPALWVLRRRRRPTRRRPRPRPPPGGPTAGQEVAARGGGEGEWPGLLERFGQHRLHRIPVHAGHDAPRHAASHDPEFRRDVRGPSGYPPRMAKDEQFRTGEHVSWKSHGGTAEGVVEEKITEARKRPAAPCAPRRTSPSTW